MHARSRAPAWSAWLACRRTGAHFVTTWHGTYSEDLPFKRRYNAVMAKGERVIAASRFIARLIVARHGTEPARIRVIPRGVDPAVFDPTAVLGDRVTRLARTWRLPEAAPPIVLLPGRLTGWKGQSVLIEALARMQRRDVCCVLVGSDQGRRRYARRLIGQAVALGVADRVRLVGECDDMPAALMLADVVVHASTQPEAFGRVVIEAQAMARPVIASDLGGPVETVEQGVTGWRVPPGDAVALARAIDAVLALPAEERAALVRGRVPRCWAATPWRGCRRRPWGCTGRWSPYRHPRAWRADPRLSPSEFIASQRRRGRQRRMAGGWPYIMSNRPNGTVYIGVTADLARRGQRDQTGTGSQLVAEYGPIRLAYAEYHPEILRAIQREKTMKHWRRAWEVRLIRSVNWDWDDLSVTL